MKVDYSQSKVYKITNDFNEDVYVGSTCDTLVKRFSKHKQNSRDPVCMERPLYMLINEIGFERFRIELICDCPCEDKYQLRQKEGEYIREIGTLNKKIAGRTNKMYKLENSDIIKPKQVEYNKHYKENNKEKLLEYQKEYYKTNLEKRSTQSKLNYEKNKLIINEKRKEKIECSCGCMIRKDSFKDHLKTKKHLQSTH
jgi:hypothetical protein